MASSNPVTNDEAKLRTQKVYAQFVSDVDPDRLSDWLVQENVITIDQWQRIRHENPAKPDRCRALLNHLFSIQHPRAFLVVRKALKKDNHYLLESMDKTELSGGMKTVLAGLLQKDENLTKRVRQLESALHLEKKKSQMLEEDQADQKRAWDAEKDCLMKLLKDSDAKLQLANTKLQRLKNLHMNQKRIWEEEQDRLLKMQTEPTTKPQQAEKVQEPEKDSKPKNSASAKRSDSGVSEQLKLDQESKVSCKGKEQLIKRTQQRRHSLENLGNLCRSDPVLVQTIITMASKKGKEINGLAILDKEVFVVSKDSSEVEVYDSMKFNFSRQWSLEELIYPQDVGSCIRNKCLYISNLKEILRVAPNGKLLKKWSTGDDDGCGLSITDESRVILTVPLKSKLNEYSPDGQLFREINLSSIKGYPLHAIKLPNGHFLVGLKSCVGVNHPIVCSVDENGKLQKSFYGDQASAIGEMANSFYLSVGGNGFVMVADLNNKRVLLLDPDLEFQREILSKEKHKLQGPSRILLDESNGRLIAADNNMVHRDAQLMIFNFK